MGWYKYEGYWATLPKGENTLDSMINPRRWQPDTDIAQAFEVVERMRVLGYGVSLYSNPYATDYRYSCRFTKTMNGQVEHSMSPSEAICLAAKAALEDGT